MSVNLDFQRTFQYFQALYSVVRISSQLFLNNENNIFPNLIPWKMDEPSYKAALENGKGIKLSSGKQKKLEALNAGKLEALKQCILESEMEIEQEMLIG